MACTNTAESRLEISAQVSSSSLAMIKGEEGKTLKLV
jgi:hypothetical protein